MKTKKRWCSSSRHKIKTEVANSNWTNNSWWDLSHSWWEWMEILEVHKWIPICLIRTFNSLINLAVVKMQCRHSLETCNKFKILEWCTTTKWQLLSKCISSRAIKWTQIIREFLTQLLKTSRKTRVAIQRRVNVKQLIITSHPSSLKHMKNWMKAKKLRNL